MSRVGQIRKPRWPIVEWCDTTYDKEMIHVDHLLLCYNDPGYCKLYNLDDGRFYTMTNSSFDVMTDEVT